LLCEADCEAESAMEANKIINPPVLFFGEYCDNMRYRYTVCTVLEKISFIHIYRCKIALHQIKYLDPDYRAMNDEIVLEGKRTCRRHRIHPEKPVLWEV
jgi:hypothetical protein